MATKEITYNQYKKLLNKIAYKLIISGKKFNHRKEYSYAGKKYSYDTVLKKIKQNGKKYTSDGSIARFMEKTIVNDNSDLSFLPKSVVRGDARFSRKNYVEAVKNTVSYRSSKSKNPKRVKISYTPYVKKYGRSTVHGCDNMGQNTGYFCACHMAQEIVRNLTNIVIPQRKIASIMGTTDAGTGHDGIDTFFAWFNRNYETYELSWTWKNFSDVGWTGLKEIYESKNKDAGEHELYRNKWGHYTNYNVIYNNTIDVQNSLGDNCGGSCYCGYVENRSKSEAKSYLSGISQKSILIVTRKK